jgi:hypothetical protein
MTCRKFWARFESGIIAGIAALLSLLVMSLNIGGLDMILPIIGNLWPMFSVASVLAFGFGLFLHKQRLRWIIGIGVATGLICGVIIVMRIVSQI